jgi:N-acylneuraminate cytidylyltransferase/CMP-N,N'-diacetyllegionaminic acid synthase
MDEARIFGATVPFTRPAELSDDKSPELHSWKHLLTHLSNHTLDAPTVLVVLPVTSPLRNVYDIIGAIDLFRTNQNSCDLIVSVNSCRKNPYFNMLESGADNYLFLSKSNGPRVLRRQEAPQVWEINNAIYVGSTRYILQTEDILSGRILGYEMPLERSLDIDTINDIEYLNFLEFKGDF